MELDDSQKAAIYDEVSKDRGLLRMIQRGFAKAHPEAVIPEIELEDQIASATAKQQEQIAALQASLEEERAKRAAAETLAAAKAKYRLDDGQLAEVSDTMLKNGITNFETGLKFQRLAAADAKRGDPGDRLSMKLPPNFAAALKDRRGSRRANLFNAIQDLRTASDHAERLSTL